MKILLSVLTAFALLAIGQPEVLEARTGNKRIKRTQVKQMKRIRHGVRNGSLTRKEAKSLARQQRRINRSRRQAKTDDGVIDKQERKQLRVRQGAASKRIYNKKHNDSQQGE